MSITPDRPPLQQRRFVPIEFGGEMAGAPHAAKLTVDLGGEKMRTLVRLVIDDDAVVVEITGVCMAKNHSFRQGDFVMATRGRHMGGHDEWKAARVAVDKAQLATLQEQRRRLEAEEAQARGRKRRRAEK